jgi:hypothetical protein
LVLPVACAVLVLTAASNGVAAPVEVPEVSVPQVSVPAVPLPAPPVPVPAPAVPVPAPPSPPPVEVPVPALPTVAVPAAPPAATTTYSAAPRQVVDAGAVVEMTAQGASERLFGRASAGPGDPASRRGRKTLFGTRYKKPRWFVRGLRGCLDEIPRASSRLLVMRYGVGRFRPMPAATVARRLDLTRREFGAARGRALRRLAVAARGSGCERERLTIATVSVEDAFDGVAVALPSPVTSLAAAPPAEAVDDAGGEVLGRSKRGESRERPAPAPAAVPPLDVGSPTSDLPFLLALFAASALFALLVYRRARRSKEAIDDPSAVTRMRR